MATGSCNWNAKLSGANVDVVRRTEAARLDALEFLSQVVSGADELLQRSPSRTEARRTKLRIEAAAAILGCPAVRRSQTSLGTEEGTGGETEGISRVRVFDREGLMRQTQDLIRYMVPYNSPVIVLGVDTEWMNLEGRRTWLLTTAVPDETGQAQPNNPNELVDEVRKRVADGARYLLVPFTTLDWLEAHNSVADALRARYRLVSDQEIFQVYALGDDQQDLTKRTIPDGLPVPPPEMISLAAGGATIESFYKVGMQDAIIIRQAMERQGININNLSSILDFGCGCGRVIRHWSDLQGPRVLGCDYNPFLVGWCQRNLPWASFAVNGAAAMLPYETGSVDLIYSISIFTHLDREAQFFWMSELSRVLSPGGHLYFSAAGASKADRLPAQLRAMFNAGELVVLAPDHAGSNGCAVYHPESFVREVLAASLEVIDFIPNGMARGRHDAWLLQKPGEKTGTDGKVQATG